MHSNGLSAFGRCISGFKQVCHAREEGLFAYHVHPHPQAVDSAAEALGRKLSFCLLTSNLSKVMHYYLRTVRPRHVTGFPYRHPYPHPQAVDSAAEALGRKPPKAAALVGQFAEDFPMVPSQAPVCRKRVALWIDGRVTS